jgi:hypothetical protein
VQYLKHCLNPKVIAALVVVAAAIWVFAPGVFAAALPVLAVAVCPLSMLAMMLLMRGSGNDEGAGSASAKPSQLASDPSADGDEIAALRADVADLQAQLTTATHPAVESTARR